MNIVYILKNIDSFEEGTCFISKEFDNMYVINEGFKKILYFISSDNIKPVTSKYISEALVKNTIFEVLNNN